MANVEETRKAVVDFLKKTLNAKDVKMVKVSKLNNGWETEAEVYEESSFIKSIGLSTKVLDRNLYSVKLSNSLEVESYERHGEERLAE